MATGTHRGAVLRSLPALLALLVALLGAPRVGAVESVTAHFGAGTVAAHTVGSQADDLRAPVVSTAGAHSTDRAADVATVPDGLPEPESASAAPVPCAARDLHAQATAGASLSRAPPAAGV